MCVNQLPEGHANRARHIYADMRLNLAALLSTIALGAAMPAAAEEAALGVELPRSSGAELPAYLECVPYARAQSGIQIFGDAWTWWDKADGLYQRGSRPQKGAVLAFEPHGNMKLGHVAAVSRVLDSRTVLLSHANWSPIDGQRGQIERDVRAIDVSPANDWSQVRVWYAPLSDLGTTAWPTHGFIYPKAQRRARLAEVAPAPMPVRPVQVAAAMPVVPARTQLAAVFAAPARPAAAPAAAKPAGQPVPSGFSQAFSGLSRPASAAKPASQAAGQATAAAPEDIIGDIIRRNRR